jgi:hypothetical protein
VSKEDQFLEIWGKIQLTLLLGISYLKEDQSLCMFLHLWKEHILAVINNVLMLKA